MMADQFTEMVQVNGIPVIPHTSGQRDAVELVGACGNTCNRCPPDVDKFVEAVVVNGYALGFEVQMFGVQVVTQLKSTVGRTKQLICRMAAMCCLDGPDNIHDLLTAQPCQYHEVLPVRMEAQCARVLSQQDITARRVGSQSGCKLSHDGRDAIHKYQLVAQIIGEYFYAQEAVVAATVPDAGIALFLLGH
jgi:hypothetical protein